MKEVEAVDPAEARADKILAEFKGGRALRVTTFQAPHSLLQPFQPVMVAYDNGPQKTDKDVVTVPVNDVASNQ